VSVITGDVVLLGRRVVFHSPRLEIKLTDLDICGQRATAQGSHIVQFFVVTKKTLNDWAGKASFNMAAKLGQFQ
jgi:hypothetical protein